MSNNQNQQNERSTNPGTNPSSMNPSLQKEDLSEQMPKMKSHQIRNLDPKLIGCPSWSPTNRRTNPSSMNPLLPKETSSIGQLSRLKENLDPKLKGSPSWTSTDLGTIPPGHVSSMASMLMHREQVDSVRSGNQLPKETSSIGQLSRLKENLEPKLKGSPNGTSTDLGTIPSGKLSTIEENSISSTSLRELPKIKSERIGTMNSLEQLSILKGRDLRNRFPNARKSETNQSPALPPDNVIDSKVSNQKNFDINELFNNQNPIQVSLDHKLREQIVQLLNQSLFFKGEPYFPKNTNMSPKEWINKTNNIIIKLTGLPSINECKKADLKIGLQLRDQIIELLIRNKDGLSFTPQSIIPTIRNQIVEMTKELITQLMNLKKI